LVCACAAAVQQAAASVRRITRKIPDISSLSD
jgi:hypothetical protein